MAEEWIEVSPFIPVDEADEAFSNWLATQGYTMADLGPSELRVDSQQSPEGELRRFRLRKGWLVDAAATRRADAPPDQFATKAVRIAADYHAFPLSCTDEDTARMLGDCPSPQLREQLAGWGQEFTENGLRDDWPEHADWVVRGRELAVQVRREISSPEIRVFYLEEAEDENAASTWIEIAL